MIPAAIAITTNAMTPMTIPKIIATLPFLVLGLTVVAGLFGFADAEDVFATVEEESDEVL